MKNKENSSVLLGKKFVYEQIADWLSSANNYDVFRDSLKISLLKSDRERGLLQTYVETKVPSMLKSRRKAVVEDYIQEVVMDMAVDKVNDFNMEFGVGIKKEAEAVAFAWSKNPFLFEDCAVASPEQIETYVNLIDKNLDLDSYEYPHLVVGYKKMMQNQRHDKYKAGETDILDSNSFRFRTGEKENTPNWDMANYVDIFAQDGYSFGE